MYDGPVVFLILLLIPLLIAIGAYWFAKGITLKEFLVHLGVQVTIAGISAAAIYYHDTTDTETISGTVTGKAKTRVSCSHSYSCHCVTSCSGSGENKTCSEVCQTCYEHDYDIDWDISTTIGSWSIDRLDSQGLKEPPRWSLVRPGDPVAKTHRYTNYIKAAPDTLFRRPAGSNPVIAPPYPQLVRDYYKVDRLVVWGPLEVDRAAWNADLQKLNGQLGAARQVNLIVVLTSNGPESYDLLERAWLGGKKNDLIAVVGTDGQTIYWVRVMAWTTDKVVQVKLRDAIMDLPRPSREMVLDALARSASLYYHRKPMADFEYLSAAIAPTSTELVVSIVLGLVISLAMSWWLSRVDLFNEGSPRYTTDRFRSGFRGFRL